MPQAPLIKFNSSMYLSSVYFFLLLFFNKRDRPRVFLNKHTPSARFFHEISKLRAFLKTFKKELLT